MPREPETTQPLLTYEQIDVRDKIIARAARDQALQEMRKIVDEQACDEGLWFVPVTITEDILQRALRRLHAAVEGEALDG